jgi:hypothetical protein
VLAGVSRFREEILLLILLIAGSFLYGALVLGLLGITWLRGLLRDAGTRHGGAPATSYEL